MFVSRKIVFIMLCFWQCQQTPSGVALPCITPVRPLPFPPPQSIAVTVGQLDAKSWQDNYTHSATMCGNHGSRRSQAMAQLRKIAVFLLKTTSVFLLDKSHRTSFKKAESCLLLAFSQSRIVERQFRAEPLAASSHLHDVLPAKQSILLTAK